MTHTFQGTGRCSNSTATVYAASREAALAILLKHSEFWR
jgi:hypothetical protein